MPVVSSRILERAKYRNMKNKMDFPLSEKALESQGSRVH